MSKELENLKGAFGEMLLELSRGVQEDLSESEDNISTLFDLIDGDTDARIIYGSMYHDALKIKGQVRDRALKLANVLKERISKIETDELKSKKDNVETESEIVVDHRSIAEEIKNNKKNGIIQSVIQERIVNNIEDSFEIYDLEDKQKK